MEVCGFIFFSFGVGDWWIFCLFVWVYGGVPLVGKTFIYMEYVWLRYVTFVCGRLVKAYGKAEESFLGVRREVYVGCQLDAFGSFYQLSYFAVPGTVPGLCYKTVCIGWEVFFYSKSQCPFFRCVVLYAGIGFEVEIADIIGAAQLIDCAVLGTFVLACIESAEIETERNLVGRTALQKRSFFLATCEQ